MSSKRHGKKHAGVSAKASTAGKVSADAQERGKAALPKATERMAEVANHAGVSALVARRFLAYLIDWYVGALCIALPVSLVAHWTTGDISNQRLVDYPAPFGLLAGVLALLFALAYYVAIPSAIWPGQTPGKRLLGIKIVRTDGGAATLSNLVMRQVVGVTLIEGVITNASSIWHQMLTIATGTNFVHPLMYIGLAFTLSSCLMILIRKDRRCLHDFIGGTKVSLVESPS